MPALAVLLKPPGFGVWVGQIRPLNHDSNSGFCQSFQLELTRISCMPFTKAEPPLSEKRSYASRRTKRVPEGIKNFAPKTPPESRFEAFEVGGRLCQQIFPGKRSSFSPSLF